MSGSGSGPLVVGLGEALFDCYPNRRVLGGAPLNVAVHAAALLKEAGGSAAAVTRIGDDALGEEALATLQSRGVATTWVQRDVDRPTGRVEVTIDSTGDASYVFDTSSAWDVIAWTESLGSLAPTCDAVAFGTLAQRSRESRETIHRFLAAAPQAIRLFDVNLRQAFYDSETIEASLRLATAAKLNKEELSELDAMLRLSDRSAGGENDAVNQLVSRYGLDWVAVTRGAKGASLFEAGQEHRCVPPPQTAAPGADTVGAGDACCAGLMVGQLLGWTLEQTLALATRAGAWVATRPGATPPLPEELRELVHRGSPA